MASINLDLSEVTTKIGEMHPALNLTRDTWIISDTHFGHANIIKYCNRPYNHNTLMLDAWRSIVKPDEYVLHLGDVTIWHTRHAYWAEQVKHLPGKKFLILGNHDEQWSVRQWRNIGGFTVTDPFVWTPDNWQARILFSHEPGMPSGKWEYNIHGHTHNHKPFGAYERLQSTYYNVSIEGMDYKPVRVGEILDELAS